MPPPEGIKSTENESLENRNVETQELNEKAIKIAEKIDTNDALKELEDVRCTTIEALKDLQCDTCDKLGDLKGEIDCGEGEIDYSEGDVTDEEFAKIKEEFDDLLELEQKSEITEDANEETGNPKENAYAAWRKGGGFGGSLGKKGGPEEIGVEEKVDLEVSVQENIGKIQSLASGGKESEEQIAGVLGDIIDETGKGEYDILRHIFSKNPDLLTTVVEQDITAIFQVCLMSFGEGANPQTEFWAEMREQHMENQSDKVVQNIKNLYLNSGINIQNTDIEFQKIVDGMKSKDCTMTYIDILEEFHEEHFSDEESPFTEESIIGIMRGVVELRKTDQEMKVLNLRDEIVDLSGVSKEEATQTLRSGDVDKISALLPNNSDSDGEKPDKKQEKSQELFERAEDIYGAGGTNEQLERQEERSEMIYEHVGDLITFSLEKREEVKQEIMSGISAEDLREYIKNIRVEELMYINDEEQLLKEFILLEDAQHDILKDLRLSDISPSLRSKTKVIENFPGNFEWVDILLIPEGSLGSKDLLQHLLIHQIDDPLTINRLLYRSLNVNNPSKTYEVYIEVFESASHDQKEKLGKRIPPVISKQDTEGRFGEYLDRNQDSFFENMPEIDQILTKEGTSALEGKEGRKNWLLAKETIERGGFGKTENLKYAISKFPELAKLALEKSPSNIMYFPTELRSNIGIIFAWVDSIDEDNYQKEIKNIDLLVLNEPYKLIEVVNKIADKFGDGKDNITSGFVQKLTKSQPKFEHMIRSILLVKHQDSYDSTPTMKALKDVVIDTQLDQAMNVNAQVLESSENSHEYSQNIKSIIEKSLHVTSSESQENARENIDTLQKLFQDYESGDIESKNSTIRELVRIFGEKDAKIFLQEFAQAVIEKEEQKQRKIIAASSTSLGNIENETLKSLVDFNESLGRVTLDKAKIGEYIQNFFLEQESNGVEDRHQIERNLIKSIQDLDISQELKQKILELLKSELKIIEEKITIEQVSTIISTVQEGGSIEEVYEDYFVEAVASGSVFKEDYGKTDSTKAIEAKVISQEKSTEVTNPYSKATVTESSDGTFILESGDDNIPISLEEANMLEKNPDAKDHLVNMYNFFKKLNLEGVWDYRQELVNAVGEININLEDDSLREEELLRFGNKLLKLISNIKSDEEAEHHPNTSGVITHVSSISALNNELSKFSRSRELGGEDRSFNTHGEDKFTSWLRGQGIIGGITFHTQKVRDKMQ